VVCLSLRSRNAFVSPYQKQFLQKPPAHYSRAPYNPGRGSPLIPSLFLLYCFRTLLPRGRLQFIVAFVKDSAACAWNSVRLSAHLPASLFVDYNLAKENIGPAYHNIDLAYRSPHGSAPRTANCWQIPQDGSHLLREARHQALSRTCWLLGHRSPPPFLSDLRLEAASRFLTVAAAARLKPSRNFDIETCISNSNPLPRIIVCVKKGSVGSCF
jgi:hypothetical protein